MQICLTTARVKIRKCGFYGRAPAKNSFVAFDANASTTVVQGTKVAIRKNIYFRMKFELERILTVKYTCGVVKGSVTTKTVLFLGLTIEEA